MEDGRQTQRAEVVSLGVGEIHDVDLAQLVRERLEERDVTLVQRKSNYADVALFNSERVKLGQLTSSHRLARFAVMPCLGIAAD